MWDERYSVEEYAYGTKPNKFLEENVSYISRMNGVRSCNHTTRAL
jgi:hypothetical protein